MPFRVLLGVGDPEKRSVIVGLLRRMGLEVAVTLNSNQTLARASVACSERAWRKPCRNDFDLILIEADLVHDTPDIMALLRQAGYSGPIIALAADPHQHTELLDAGFDDLVSYPTTNTKNDLHGGGSSQWPRTIRQLQRHLSPIRSRI